MVKKITNIIEPINDTSLENLTKAIVMDNLTGAIMKKQGNLIEKQENKKIVVQNYEINLLENNYICLTDIAKKFGGDDLVKNWLQNKNTIEFLGIWEKLNNKDFNLVEFHQIKIQAGLNRFLMSVKKWTELTKSIGLTAKTGKYNSGTYAHQDIAFEFASWVSPEFKLYLIKEFQRLKEAESLSNEAREWNLSRFLSKVNYSIHSDAVKENLLDLEKNKDFDEWVVYAMEADVLNRALFGKTAKQWRIANPNVEGNIRDYASINELIVLSNLESNNAKLMRDGINSKRERFLILQKQAQEELQSLSKNKKLQNINNNLFITNKK